MALLTGLWPAGFLEAILTDQVTHHPAKPLGELSAQFTPESRERTPEELPANPSEKHSA
jgi:hypothetical protein